VSNKNKQLAIVGPTASKVSALKDVLASTVMKLCQAKYDEHNLESKLAIALKQSISDMDIIIERLNKLEASSKE